MIATEWKIGPSRQYTKPSDISLLVKDFDTISIDKAEYIGDVCSWYAKGLYFNGESGTILKANGKAAEQKAIWVIKGDDCIVEGIDFRDCAVVDRNGAGIRIEGTNILVRSCAFRNNQDGILCGANPNSTVIVEQCEFENSGAGDGLSHGIYIGHIKAFYYQFNYAHGTKVGHEVKSRAAFNMIAYNNISQEKGTGSRNIDLPNGGTSFIIGNILQHSANAENGNTIGYGLEGLRDNLDNSLFVASNTFVNERSAGTFFRIDTNTNKLVWVNNIFSGSGAMLVGNARIYDTAYNVRFQSISDAKFKDPVVYDYSLTKDSPALSSAISPGYGNYIENEISREISLLPLFEYAHPCNSTPRFTHKSMGSLEGKDIISRTDFKDNQSEIFPNPCDRFLICNSQLSQLHRITIVDMQGNITIENIDNSIIDVSSYQPGTYIIYTPKQTYTIKVLR
jgi:hypothetical protein